MKLYVLGALLVPLLLSSGAVAEDVESVSEPNPALVTVKQGTLQGLTLESRKGQKYYGFLGVPYGKAVVRFGNPQSPDSWEGVKMATKIAPYCFQYCLVAQRLIGVEDCLTLNVYSRKLDGKAPVIVKIHGGGFQFGSGSYNHAKYFMDEDVVLVTIQYRLGALGFLSTEDEVVSGNMGMKDQTAALKWVQENIAKFGGDPDKVTIVGYSAGGASVHYLMLSPLSKGLFSSAISMSGSALNPWAQQPKPKELATRLADSLECTHENSEKLVECLRNKTPAQIVNAQLKFSKFPHEFDVISMLFSPSVEKGEYQGKFLSENPYKIMVSGQTASKVPWMAGFTAEEGAFYIALIMENEKSLELINSNWYKMAPNILYYEATASPAAQSRVSGKVKEFYFGDKKIGHDTYVEFGRVYGDRFFLAGITRAIKEHARKPEFPIYPYVFNYTGSHSIQTGLLNCKKYYGMGHGEDLQYLFNKTYGSPEHGMDTPEGKFSEKFVKLWVSFATDGKPTATWGPATSWEPFVLTQEDENENPIPWYLIDDETRIVDEDLYKSRTDFWESLPLRELDKIDVPEEKDEL